MEVSSFVLLYFGTNIFVRCSEVSVGQRCPLMEVPLYVNFNDQQNDVGATGPSELIGQS